MTAKEQERDPIPEEFGSYEEAAEFWDSHDTTEYPEAFARESAELRGELRQRHWEVEVDEDLIPSLREQARETGVSVQRMVSDLLRRQLASSS